MKKPVRITEYTQRERNMALRLYGCNCASCCSVYVFERDLAKRITAKHKKAAKKKLPKK